MDPNQLTPNIHFEPIQQPFIPPTPKSSNKLFFVIGGLIIILIGIFGSYYLTKSNSKPPVKGCSLEARICPDGSAVGRTGPNCEFTPCPQITTTPTPTPNLINESSPSAIANWKTWINNTYGYEFQYPNNWFINPNNGSEILSDASLDGYNYPDYVISFSIDVPFPDRVDITASVGTKKEVGDKVFETKIADLNVGGHRAARFQTIVLPGSATDAHNKKEIKVVLGSKYLYIEHWIDPPRKNTVEINKIFDQILSTFKFL